MGKVHGETFIDLQHHPPRLLYPIRKARDIGFKGTRVASIKGARGGGVLVDYAAPLVVVSSYGMVVQAQGGAGDRVSIASEDGAIIVIDEEKINKIKISFRKNPGLGFSEDAEVKIS